MTSDNMFCSLSATLIADFIRAARESVCYAAPGIQVAAAHAIVETASRLGPEMVTVCIDFDERAFRMGYGDIEAVKHLRDAGIMISSAPTLRTALVIVDSTGFIFTPTALYLEADTASPTAPNAVRMSGEQIAEALARLSFGAKSIAKLKARSPEEKARIESLPIEVGSNRVTDADFSRVSCSLDGAPPVRFDLARQVRVFEPYLQYIELSLTGAAIQRHRLTIPPSIQHLGGSKEVESRLQTTYELIERGNSLSSRPLEDALNVIRKDFTRSLGKNHGRVILKAVKPQLLARLNDFRDRLAHHRSKIAEELNDHLQQSRCAIIDYYLPRVVDNPPDALRGQVLADKPSGRDSQYWLVAELDRVFPRAESLIDEMKLEVTFKDVTFETLSHEGFLKSVKTAYPSIDWERTYEEFRAAGESNI